ncbi:MAG: response regulator transcription factor [Ignavibacteriae bacterium]|nr:response regulator transcription factor [Ignavibacteriota bacterium]
MTILIVDDSTNIRKALVKSLNSLVPQVKKIIQKEDIDDAIATIEKEKPDIMILDLMLKSGTGLDLLKAIKLKENRPMTILYSNFLDSQYKSSAKKLGVEEYFDKSDDIFKLVDIIKKYIK